MRDLSKFAVITSVLAFALSLTATIWCGFVERDVEIEDDGPFQGINERLRDLLLEDHGVGFWGWELGGDCFDYSVNGEDPDFDRKWRSARAFNIVAVILGGLVMLALAFSCGTPMGPKFFLCCGFFAFLASLFEGLTLLILQSDICEPGFFGYSIGDELPDLQGVSVDCSLASGSKVAISATAVWFVEAILCMIVAKKYTEAKEEKGGAPPQDSEADNGEDEEPAVEEPKA